MERGFYHPERGYWQTNSEPSPETLAGYPTGTIEVPLKPGADHEWQNGEWVYVPPPEPEPAPLLTALQLIIGLVKEGWISEADGDAWLDGTPPPQVDLLISQMPEDERFEARARAKRFTSVERDDPMVEGLGMIAGKTPEELDAFFWEYSQL